jgi:hypothetical protein
LDAPTALAHRAEAPLAPTRLLARIPSWIRLLLAWLWLDLVLNVRYPGKETRFWYLVPCVDTVVLFAGLALLGRAGRRLPPAAHAALTALLLLVRAFRVADGVSLRFLAQPFNLLVNFSLVSELPNLLETSLPLYELTLYGLALFAGAVGMAVVSYGALRLAERELAVPGNVRLAAGIASVFALASAIPRVAPTDRRGKLDDRFSGAFASSGVLRIVSEAKLVLHSSARREARRRAVLDARSELARMPTDLSKLKGADVLLVLVESYGEVVLERPDYLARVEPVFSRFERELGALGYRMASNILESPTFGNGSWLAHVTLNSGVRATDQFEYGVVCNERPPILSDFFRRAGYRTVLVQAATAHATLFSDYLRFDTKYFNPTFDYRGPLLGWVNIADQYVLGFVHQRELADRKQPRFIEYALTTSHAPWSAQPSVLEDWSKLGDGSVLSGLPVRQHHTTWSKLDEAGAAYIDAIVYDLEVLERYLASELHNDTLVIILGDHQPPGVVREGSSHGVPIHVLSRRPDLVEPFQARGYAPGMRPTQKAPHLGMETFLFSFLRDFSRDLRQTSVVGGPLP